MTAVRVEVDWYPLDIAASILGYSKPTIRRWAKNLRAANIEEFDHEPYEESISAQSMRVYQRMAELRNQKVSVSKSIEDIRIKGI